MLSLVRAPEERPLRPLEEIQVAAPAGSRVEIVDAQGRVYGTTTADANGVVRLTVGGALGRQVVRIVGKSDEAAFTVDAETTIDDGGDFRELHQVLLRTMRCYSPDGTAKVRAHGREWRCYVPWILDHVHTMKGMRWHSDANADLLDLWQKHQREDGMVWSNVENYGAAPPFHYWAYKDQGYAWAGDGLRLMRQPVENHNEYNYVDAIHYAWKANGDNTWMAGKLDSAIRALNYSLTDRARFSAKLGLLKRGNTIDSWDFQASEPGRPKFPMGESQQIDPDHTRFVIFFGDNHGYAEACDQLAEMLDVAGRSADATRLRERARTIRTKLEAIAWNGKFFTHHVEEDPTTVRDLGVDEKSQIAMSNAYALNRGVEPVQAAAILATYRALRAALPERAPAEWYAIYPPYGKGFGHDGQQWQYMNGGVQAHAGGELARGAFRHGDEIYGVETLLRALHLARSEKAWPPVKGAEHAVKDVVRFAYTGAYPPAPPQPVHRPLDLSAQCTMDFSSGVPGVPSWMGERPGNDMRGLPVGERRFLGIPFIVADPAANGGRGCIGTGPDLAAAVEIPLGGATAGALNLLHSCNTVGPSGVAGVLTIIYADGGTRTVSIIQGRHLTGWWFPGQPSERDSGVAWRGACPASGDVGVHWCAIAHGEPQRAIRALRVTGSHEGSRYALIGLTLADRMPYHEAHPISFGGPDNWSGGLCMAALMEGLCGVADAPGHSALQQVTLSPRWTAAGRDSVAVTARYGASTGYVAYRWHHEAAARRIRLILTGGGDGARLRVLLPENAGEPKVEVDGAAVAATVETVQASRYAVCPVALGRVVNVVVRY